MTYDVDVDTSLTKREFLSGHELAKTIAHLLKCIQTLILVLGLCVACSEQQVGKNDGRTVLPAVTITANPESIVSGQSSFISWSSTNATGCYASGGWTSERAVSGSQLVTPAATTPYTLICIGPGGSSKKSVLVTVESPTTMSFVYPLKIGAASHHLVDQNEKPFLLTGDAGWSIIAELSNRDAELYLANRQQLGFNLVLVNLIEHKFATNAPANIYGISPFIGKVFSTPNDAYFRHADYIIQSAAKKGIVVLLDPAYVGYRCGDEGWCAEMKLATDSEMTAWGQFLGKRYAKYDNIMWLIGGDTDPASVKGKLQSVVNGIRQYDTRHVFTAHNQRGTMAIDPWSGAKWLTVNNIYTSDLSYMLAQRAYTASPAMPFFLIESYYENEHSTTQQELRAQSYWTVLSGGFGHIFGNCPIWGFGSETAGQFCSSSDWKTELNGQGSVNMKYFQKLFNSRHWNILVPDLSHTALIAGTGTSGRADYATAAYASDGSSIIAYLPTSRTVTVSGGHLSGASMTAWWFNPTTGAPTKIGTYPTAGTQSFTPPSSGDWILVVDSATFSFPAPGA